MNLQQELTILKGKRAEIEGELRIENQKVVMSLSRIQNLRSGLQGYGLLIDFYEQVDGAGFPGISYLGNEHQNEAIIGILQLLASVSCHSAQHVIRASLERLQA